MTFRRSFFAWIAVVIASVAAARPAAAQSNVLANPGFETGALAPWFDAFGFGGWSISSTDPHAGSFCARADGNTQLRQTFAPIPTDDVDEVSFWIKNADGIFNGVALYYDDGTEEQVNVFHDGNTAWLFYDITADLDSGKSLEAIGLWGYSGGQFSLTFYDDVVVSTTSSGRLALAVEGECPGTITVSWENATPNSRLGLVFATETGSFVVPSGQPCAGTTLGLGRAGIRLVADFPSGSNGVGSRDREVGIGVCGGFLQLIEAGRCATSDVEQID